MLFDTGEIAGFGWSCFTVAQGAAPGRAPGIVAARDDVHELSNEYLRITVDPADGTYSIETIGPDEMGLRVNGCGRLVDGGDGGDTYNYSPPDVDVVVDRPVRVRVVTTESGPVRARLTIDADYSWPASRSATSVRAAGAATRPPRRASVRRWSSGPASDSYVSRTRSTTTRATTGCARTSRYPRR